MIHPPRRPRLFCILLALPFLFLLSLLLLYRFSWHSALDLDLFPNDPNAGPSAQLPSEIFGLLHFVTSPDETRRVIVVAPDDINGPVAPGNDNDNHDPDATAVPDKPIALAWYALGSIAKTSAGDVRALGRAANDGWDERLRVLREEYPVVVFSKTYCPYSRRAKKLLEMYKLSPPPKIIEVDQRPDASHIKTVLTRLTQQSTFPNVIVHGRSLGGSDDLMRLHEEGRLRHVLQSAGVSVGWTDEAEDEDEDVH